MSVKLRKRKREHGKTYVYLDIYQMGTRKTELLGILSGDRLHDKEDLKMYDEVRAKRDYELKGEAHGVMGAYKKRQNFIQYCEGLAETRPTANTRQSWKQAIDHLRTFGGERLVFADLNRPFFEKFRDYLLKTANLSPNSAQVYLTRIKTAIHQAVDDNILSLDPASSVTIKRQDKLPLYLSIEELQKLSETPCHNEQVKQAFFFSCFTGLRYSDVDPLTWDKVKDGYLEFTQQKTGDAERMPLSKEANRILKEQENAKPRENLRRTYPANTVFFLPVGPLVDRYLKAWAKAAEIDKKISFHKARHTFATMSLSSGNDLYVTSKLLGHKSFKATQIYAKVIDEKKKEAVSMFPQLKRQKMNGEQWK